MIERVTVGVIEEKEGEKVNKEVKKWVSEGIKRRVREEESEWVGKEALVLKWKEGENGHKYVRKEVGREEGSDW